MKAATWLCPALTLLCAINLVFTAQKGSYGGYPLDSWDSQMLQNDYFLYKRNKPSLSIVNPLDVLRQRLLLEIARRQMKENSRQVELNRAILKNVGKRATSSKYALPFAAHLYNTRELQQQQTQQLQDPIELLQPNEYELLPTTLIFDYLQQQEQRQQQQQQHQHRPWLAYDSNSLPFVNNYINEDIIEAARASSNTPESDAEIVEENAEPDLIAFDGMMGNTNKQHSLQHIKQSNNEHSSSNKLNQQREATTFQKSLINNHQLYRNKNDLNLNLNDENPVSLKPSENDYKHEQRNDNDGDYQLQHYLYHLHKNQNHLTRN